MIKKIKGFFYSKKIILTKTNAPAEFVKSFTSNGRRYVRIAFTNRVKFKDHWPMTDVLYSDVIGVRRMPSAFKKLRFKLIGKPAKSKTIIFKK